MHAKPKCLKAIIPSTDRTLRRFWRGDEKTQADKLPNDKPGVLANSTYRLPVKDLALKRRKETTTQSTAVTALFENAKSLNHRPTMSHKHKIWARNLLWSKIVLHQRSQNLTKSRLLRSRGMSTPIRNVPIDEVSFQLQDADISEIV